MLPERAFSDISPGKSRSQQDMRLDKRPFATGYGIPHVSAGRPRRCCSRGRKMQGYESNSEPCVVPTGAGRVLQTDVGRIFPCSRQAFTCDGDDIVVQIRGWRSAVYTYRVHLSACEHPKKL